MKALSAMADDAVDTDLPLAVAGDTIIHIQSSNLFYLLHGLDRPMAGLACDFRANVRPMLKKDKVGHRSRLAPLNRLLSVPVAFQLLHFWLVCRRDFVAPHATLDGGNAGYGSSASIDVAILARYLVITRVDLMAEGNRLNGSRCPAGKSQSHSDGYDKEGQQACPDQPLFHSKLFLAEASYVGDQLMDLLIR